MPRITRQERLRRIKPEWAIVEIFGHRRHAGQVHEVERFGAKMLRVDVTIRNERGELEVIASPIYGGAAIFSVTPATLERVLEENSYAAQRRRPVLLAPREENLDEESTGGEADDPPDFSEVEPESVYADAETAAVQPPAPERPPHPAADAVDEDPIF